MQPEPPTNLDIVPVEFLDTTTNEQVTVWIDRLDTVTYRVSPPKFLFRSDYHQYLRACEARNQQLKKKHVFVDCFFFQSERPGQLIALNELFKKGGKGASQYQRFSIHPNDRVLLRNRTLQEVMDEVFEVTKEFYQLYQDYINDTTTHNSPELPEKTFYLVFTGGDHISTFDYGGGIERYVLTLNPTVIRGMVKNIGNRNNSDYTFKILEAIVKKNVALFKQYFYQVVFEELEVLTDLKQRSMAHLWLFLFLSCETEKEVQFLKVMECVQSIIRKDWPEEDKEHYLNLFFRSLNTILEKDLIGKHLESIQQLLQDEYLTTIHSTIVEMITKTVDMVYYGKVESSFATRFIKSMEQSRGSSIILIVEIDGKKKKVVMQNKTDDLMSVLEEKLSLSMKSFRVDVFDDDCNDWVSYDPNEHVVEKLNQPVKLKLTEFSQNFEEGISKIDQYTVTKLLRTETLSSTTTDTFIVEHPSEKRKLILKYMRFKDGQSEEMVSILQKVQGFNKPNLVQVTVFTPKMLNNHNVEIKHHIAFTMTYYSHGSLASLVREKVNITPRLILSIMKYTLEALNSLEEAHSTYGNIKAENILVEHLDLPSNSIKIRISDWWKKEDSPSNQLHILGLLFLNLLSGQVQDMTTVESMNSQSIQDLIKQKHEKGSSTSLSITTEVTQFLLDKHPIYSSSSNNKNTARQCLKLLYKLVKDSQQK